LQERQLASQETQSKLQLAQQENVVRQRAAAQLKDVAPNKEMGEFYKKAAAQIPFKLEYIGNPDLFLQEVLKVTPDMGNTQVVPASPSFINNLASSPMTQYLDR